MIYIFELHENCIMHTVCIFASSEAEAEKAFKVSLQGDFCGYKREDYKLYVKKLTKGVISDVSYME